jgi:hypothetical protein
LLEQILENWILDSGTAKNVQKWMRRTVPKGKYDDFDEGIGWITGQDWKRRKLFQFIREERK